MNKILGLVICVGMVMVTFAGARADASFRGFRLGAKDIQATEKFYERVFGFKELERSSFVGLERVVLGFETRQNTTNPARNFRVILLQRTSDPTKDVLPHLILTIDDIAKAIADIQETGGSLVGKSHRESVGSVQLVSDPAGNYLELVYGPKS